MRQCEARIEADRLRGLEIDHELANSPNFAARERVTSVSAMSRRMIAPTDRISLMPPAVWP